MDLNEAIRMAVDTGKVFIGSKQALKSLFTGSVKAIVAASGSRHERLADFRHFASRAKIPFILFPGSSLELGSVCGKPFPVSVVTILEPGSSPILELVEKKEKLVEETGEKTEKG